MSISNIKNPEGNLGELNQKLVESYDDLVKNVPSSVGSILRMEELDKPYGLFAFWDSVPHPRKWEGSRVAKGVELKEISFKSEPHELTIKLPLDHYRTSTFSSLLNKLESVAAAQSRLADREVAKVLGNGTSTAPEFVGYDGQAIFSAAHPRNDGSLQSNLITTNALSATNIKVAYNRLSGFTDAEGVPLLLRPSAIVVPSGLALQAQDAINSTLIGGGNSNVLQTLGLEVIVLPELDQYSPTDWYLVAGAPITHFQFKAPEFNVFDDSRDQNVFYNREVVMGWDAHYHTRVGLWQSLVKSSA
jgi:phage major head subunit gpT-like protein